MTAEPLPRHLVRWILDLAESFFANLTFRIIQLKDRWGMNR